MKARVIAAASIAAPCCSPPRLSSRARPIASPGQCRRPAARADRRSADRPRRLRNRRRAAGARPSRTSRCRSAAPAAVADPSFEAFRKQLGAVAEKKDRKALAGLVAQNFFWMGEKGDKADKKKPGIENLAKAIQLDGKEAPGWEMLGAACRRSDRHAVSGSQGHDLLARRSDLQCAGVRGARQVDRHRRRRLGLSDADRPRGARRAAAQFAGGREARPAFRPRDAGQTRPAIGSPMLQGRHAIRQDRFRAGRGAEPARQRPALLQQGRRRLEDLGLHRRRPVIADQRLKISRRALE